MMLVDARLTRGQYTKKLRDNLLHVKKLLELVQEREKTKMLQAEVLSNAFLQLLYPYAQAMRAAFERISGYVLFITSNR
jgi:hypothetical protein